MSACGAIHLLSAGLEELAAPFTPEEAQVVVAELDGVRSAAAELFIAGHCGSTFELAWRLLEQGRLPAWGAALGLVQQAGRGQFRRGWYSPLGNMHVSFRLPAGGPLAGDSAAILVALLFCEAFQALGLPLLLKWPNDLVLDSGGSFGKLGGILLEEKNGVLIAGVGINAASIPGSGPACGSMGGLDPGPVTEHTSGHASGHALAHVPGPGIASAAGQALGSVSGSVPASGPASNWIRPGAGLPAALLPPAFTPHTPICLWLALVKSLIMIYEDSFMVKSHMNLLRRAEERLLWRGREVLVTGESGGDAPFYGVITGLSEQGGLMLLGSGAGGAPLHREITSGSIVEA